MPKAFSIEFVDISLFLDLERTQATLVGDVLANCLVPLTPVTLIELQLLRPKDALSELI